MEYKVVPIEATDEMKQAAIWACDYRIGGDAAENAFRPENLEDKCPIQAAIAAAPDTGMIAVDKAEHEQLKSQLHSVKEAFEKIIDIEWRDGLRHLDNPTDYAERVAALSALSDAKVIAKQALKDMGGK